MAKSTDRIEKEILLRAPRSRVWRAISNSQEFGTWFRLELDGEFKPGATVHARVTIPEWTHLKVEMRIERVEPEALLSYRWHPAPVEKGRDYSAEPMTLVELRLAERPGGTLLTVVESGFDQLSLERRAEAFRLNDGGWTEQLHNIESHVTAQ
jgi:uncharacterized protein YndB with AHSA1/START domain